MTSLKDIRLAIFGPGLLGGSLLHDARALGAAELRVWARRGESLAAVGDAGLADFSSTDPAAVAEGADILVLCVPVGGMKVLAEQLAASHPAAGAVFTDVGSVKGLVMREVAPALTGAGFTFIGAHPMAGSEKGGFAAARPGLYQDRACLLTPLPETPPAPLARLEAFWQAFGCRTFRMDAAVHDAVVARISHLPHVAAVLTVLASLQSDPDNAGFAAGGLRDTTRVASGIPDMWSGILLANRDALLPALRDFQDQCAGVIRMLEQGDSAPLTLLLEQAKLLRDNAAPFLPADRTAESE